ncbi:hypothetical protein FORC098_4680 [Salmonella enterica subsp. enterica serovar Typhimurium]|nr:hypothetical protein FORC098_4680 [Salmonella enterica subsp. enterica serovar Typhimurium]
MVKTYCSYDIRLIALEEECKKISMNYQSGTDPINAAPLDKRHNIPRLCW